jgi:hypothetical protein
MARDVAEGLRVGRGRGDGVKRRAAGPQRPPHDGA